MKTLPTISLLTAMATAAALLLSAPAMAQKTGRYAGYGAGIGALIGLVAGDDIDDVAAGAVIGAAGGGLTGAVIDSREEDARRAAAEAHYRAQQEHKVAELQRQQAMARQARSTESGTGSTHSSSDAELARLIGADNYASYKALRGCDYLRASALARVGELSSNPDHRLASLWLDGLIAIDQRDQATAQLVFQRVVEVDPDIDSIQQASLETDRVVLDLRAERRSMGLPSCHE